jgi:phosphinothricin acetyltransferase
MLRPVREEDAPKIAGIYNYYIENTPITFEEEPLSPAEMVRRIRAVSAAYPWIVWEGEEGLSGYIYANRWKDRASFRYAAELSIYLRRGSEGRGIGSALMKGLLDELRNTNINALLAGITLPNPRSIALHEKFGFEKAARFKEAGWKLGEWRDLGYWELLLKPGSSPP